MSRIVRALVPGSLPKRMDQAPVTWQPRLFGSAELPRVDETFCSLVHLDLDHDSWLDYQPGWLTGSDELLVELVQRVSWGQRRRTMYDREVDEPRLTAHFGVGPDGPPLPAVVEAMRSLLAARYGVEFDSVGLNLYRDGRDSVAWHGDRIDAAVECPVVALVSLGEARRFLLRPRGHRGQSSSLSLGHGDLLVTGGRFQRAWQHSVPKAKGAGARISLAFRHGASSGLRGHRV